MEKHPSLPKNLSTYDTVGVRMPNHDWLRSLIDECGPIAATSANISGQPSLATAKDVLATLNERIDLLIDGGTCAGGIPSTVVDCTAYPIKILRKGFLSEEAIFSTISNGLKKGEEKNDI